MAAKTTKPANVANPHPRLLGGGPPGVAMHSPSWRAGPRDPRVAVCAEGAAASKTHVAGGGIRRCLWAAGKYCCTDSSISSISASRSGRDIDANRAAMSSSFSSATFGFPKARSSNEFAATAITGDRRPADHSAGPDSPHCRTGRKNTRHPRLLGGVPGGAAKCTPAAGDPARGTRWWPVCAQAQESSIRSLGPRTATRRPERTLEGFRHDAS